MKSAPALLPASTDRPWLAQVDTPAVLVDLNIVERNIGRCQQWCDDHGLRNRPHIKTHKLPLLAHAQLAAGACGITCQKLGEAEVMADAGVQDILISYNIVGAAKLDRLRALAGRAQITVCSDSRAVVAGIAEAFADAPQPIDVLVECDTGMHRCGVTTPHDAADLAGEITRMRGLRFAGLMSYPAAGGGRAAAAWLAQAKDACRNAGLDVRTISSGGTPDLYRFEPGDAITEYRPGSYIYNDRSLVASGACEPADCALTVLTTVVSCPAPDRAVVDAGSKVLTSDLFGLERHGMIADRPDIEVVSLSEEHGHLHLEGGGPDLAVGQILRIIPNHACVVSNMVDQVTLIRGDGFVRHLAVAARGKVR